MFVKISYYIVSTILNHNKIKMKKHLLLIPAIMLTCSLVFAASEDTQIEDAINQQDSDQVIENIKDLNENFKFQKFNTCGDMEKTVEDFVKLFSNRWYRGGMEYSTNELWSLVDGAASPTQADVSMSAGEKVKSSSTDYSTTNVQVQWVDEPEILKTDGKYLYYYNDSKKKIYIINSPLDTKLSEIDLNKAEILKTIKIPEWFYGVQLFLSGNKLAIIWSRYVNLKNYNTILDKSTRTTVIIYDTTDVSKLDLLKLYDINWNYYDARFTNNELYIVSKSYLNFYYAYPLYRSDVKAQDMEPDFSASDLLPKQIEVTKKSDTWKVKDRFNITASNVDCNDIMYLFPTKETVEKYNVSPTLAIVSKIDMSDLTKKPATKVLFGDVSQMYMSNDNLYLVNNFYIWYNFNCPAGAMCMMPAFRSWENSLIHKFNLKQDLTYQNSAIIPWLPLTQYSMEEDSQWNFQILSKTWWTNLNTHLFILSPDLSLKWKLNNIKDKEEFKASRYIWDKLYLVTYQSIDPLFVIDTSDKSNPKILWELEIPWYSKYLHPYADEENWVQYLIWLWYDTKTNQWGWTQNAWLKIDLYKIDYNKTTSTETWNNISIEQKFSTVLGTGGSWSEALENPRMFVWDKKNKLLLMPMILQKIAQEKSCYTDYLGKTTCNDIDRSVPTFAWIKWFTIDVDSGIKEVLSKDYLDILKSNDSSNPYQYFSEREFRNMNFRVGYLWDAIDRKSVV